ncbi:hypothetical protein J6590_031497 [Homalodisca vitripennis]|nr:hypothetical protein J6590_031497 [Homalodisca vitripennis]
MNIYRYVHHGLQRFGGFTSIWDCGSDKGPGWMTKDSRASDGCGWDARMTEVTDKREPTRQCRQGLQA